MENLNKKSVNKGVKSMTAKAMSWNQVCKQLSGMGGYVEIGEGEKVRPLVMMQSLGVNVSKNSYKPTDIFAAWSERMKDGKQVLMSKGVPYTIEFMGVTYRLHVKSTKEEGVYVGVSMKQLCPLVSAADKDTNTVTVSAANVLRGLQQSLYVDDTLDAIEKSEKKCAAMKEGWVNLTRDRKSPAQWLHVEKKNGEWYPYVSQEEKEPAAKKAAQGAQIDSAEADYNMGLITEEEYEVRIKVASAEADYLKGLITKEEYEAITKIA